MKTGTTLQWLEHFLSKFAVDKSYSYEGMDKILEYLRLHASQLQDSAEQRLTDLERKVRALESDAGLAKIRSGK